MIDMRLLGGENGGNEVCLPQEYRGTPRSNQISRMSYSLKSGHCAMFVCVGAIVSIMIGNALNDSTGPLQHLEGRIDRCMQDGGLFQR